uniref:TRASH domain-containing protein n=1 Tax=Scophthalmus maximus TaxID=52904 RepID=A0A8D3B7E0_SCOMX
EKGAMKEFCSQNCLTSFNYKKNPSSYRKTDASKHEVILSGAVHKMCSDACFNRFRTLNNLSMACCADCGSYCHTKPLMLKTEDGSKTVCNSECLAKYKEKSKIHQPCLMCRTTRLLAETIDNRNSDDSVNFFCSSSCVMAFKVQTVSASGARLDCDSCGKNTVPAYHLAMSDTSIRNFCTLPCVMVFQEKFKKSQKQVNVFTKLPIGSTQIQQVAPPAPQQDVGRGPLKLDCSQCNRSITFKPELVQIQDKVVFLCSVDCAHEFKKANYVTSLCEYCKIEKITRDAKRIDNKDCYFCSDGEETDRNLLFRHDLTKNWGKHCHSCVYCHCVSKKLVTAQYGGTTEEFCSEDCRSKYTMLFCHVAKCDTCGCKGKLRQTLPLLGSVKHFCDLSCLLQFCSLTVSTQGEVFKATSFRSLGYRFKHLFFILILWGGCAGTSEVTPVIGNVISLAGPPMVKPITTDRSISVQTDTIKAPPPPAPKILKNKALLCRPLVQNKGVSCKAQTADAEVQTDDAFPKMMILPVPVPVYVPVPMNMYSQCTPRPVGLPVPLPVPMFLPVTMNSAERIVETIQEIKAKIPSDPFEAELILMAEMVAEQDEKNNNNYSDDLDTDDLASFLNNWEDASSDADAPAGMPFSEPLPPAPPPMDVEADFSPEKRGLLCSIRFFSLQFKVKILDSCSLLTPALSHQKGRKSQRSSKAAQAASQRASSDVAVELPKLKSQYGVDAWKRWIQWRETQPNLEKPRFGSRPIELKEDVLQCTTAELSYGLCCFINEVKRPNGELYSPDSLFYLCLGIQKYLFEKGRVENIFMDRFYNKFSTDFTTMLRSFKPSITTSGYVHSRVEEEFLWDCKQLGAYSPIVLLNTLIFFCCKYFGFTTAEQHRQLSFAHVMRCTKTNPDSTKTTFLRFYPPISVTEVPAKKRKEEESKEEILEMTENTENPLRCPVRLYEFYLSKCSESVKQRTNLFYLLPERCCVPNSPLWFSSADLDDGTLDAMLIRILTVRELHLKKRKGEETEQTTPSDPPFIPEEEEEEEEEDGDSE